MSITNLDVDVLSRYLAAAFFGLNAVAVLVVDESILAEASFGAGTEVAAVLAVLVRASGDAGVSAGLVLHVITAFGGCKNVSCTLGC
jgi:hypothetical protein